MPLFSKTKGGKSIPINHGRVLICFSLSPNKKTSNQVGREVSIFD